MNYAYIILNIFFKAYTSDKHKIVYLNLIIKIQIHVDIKIHILGLHLGINI